MSELCKKQRKMERYIEGLELQTDCLQEHNTFLINENNMLKEMVKGIEWNVGAICTYLTNDS